MKGYDRVCSDVMCLMTQPLHSPTRLLRLPLPLLLVSSSSWPSVPPSPPAAIRLALSFTSIIVSSSAEATAFLSAASPCTWLVLELVMAISQTTRRRRAEQERIRLFSSSKIFLFQLK